MDGSKIVLKLGSQAIGVVETRVWTADKQLLKSNRWRFSRKNDWVVQVIPQQAIKAMRAGALYSLLEKQCSGGRSWDGTFYYGVRSFTAVCCGAVSSRDSFYMKWCLMQCTGAKSCK
jgi:hypothetical protein